MVHLNRSCLLDQQMEHCNRNPWLLSIFLQDLSRSVVQVAGRSVVQFYKTRLYRNGGGGLLSRLTMPSSTVHKWLSSQYISCSHLPCALMNSHSSETSQSIFLKAGSTVMQKKNKKKNSHRYVTVIKKWKELSKAVSKNDKSNENVQSYLIVS